MWNEMKAKWINKEAKVWFIGKWKHKNGLNISPKRKSLHVLMHKNVPDLCH
jgi:hypothetical protein